MTVKTDSKFAVILRLTLYLLMCGENGQIRKGNAAGHTSPTSYGMTDRANFDHSLKE